VTPDELARYSRHLLLPEFGQAGQERLRAARLLIVGLGGLGSPAGLYLAAAGVGTLGLVDVDAVELSNLQRQIIHATPDIGRPKIASAADRLRATNPHVALELHDAPFDAGNARRLVEAYDVIIDGTDNFPTRYLVNDACVMAGKPNVYGSVFRFEGQASVFASPAGLALSEPSASRLGESKGESRGPCYRCLHPEPPPAGLIPSCAEGGVLGVLPGFIGVVQATEAIKLITGIGEPLIGRVLLYDALRMRVREIALNRDPECPVCGDDPTIRELVRYDQTCECVAGGGSGNDMTPEELKEWRDSGKAHVLIDVREASEHAICRIEGSRLIPMAQLMGELSSLPAGVPVVCHCKGGGRSARATNMLRQRGYDAHNLTGGILGWIERVDPSLTRY
jgi:molybdopterin/thiamine biosynthesis adenylyltransferase/rhodanese-related sulfurtransferase